MSLTTAQDFILNAFRKCGQIRPGYTPQAELMADALNEFQLLFDGYNAERTMQYQVPDYVLPIGTATSLNGIYGQFIQYTLGPTFTFSGTTTNTSKTVLTPNGTTGLIIGQYVTGAGIPANTYITGITQNSGFTISNAATASATVTLSIAASFNIPRPESIIRANLWMNSTSPTQPSRIPLSPVGEQGWANIWVLQITPINVATVFWYNPTFPQGTFNVWPPLNGNSLEIFTWGFLTPPTALTTVMQLPPGYGDVVVYSLAWRLWPMLTKSVLVNKITRRELGCEAAVARDRVKAVNAPQPKLANDFRGGHGVGTGVSDWGLLLTGIPS